MAKRGREEEPEYVTVAHDLEAAAGRDADAARKTKAGAASFYASNGSRRVTCLLCSGRRAPASWDLQLQQCVVKFQAKSIHRRRRGKRARQGLQVLRNRHMR